MKFLNGVENKVREVRAGNQPEFCLNLPEKVDESLIAEVSERIEKMNKNYSLFSRRNALLSAVAILNNQINEIENEINGI